MATQVIHASLGTTPYRVSLSDDSHQWLSDVPAALGGGDSAPRRTRSCSRRSAPAPRSPWQCTRSASSGRWKGIDVQLNIVEERTKPEPFTHIRREIRLDGALDAEQRQRLLEIANACPIHRVLSGEVSISSQLRD
ncbi:putative redox protein [Pseudomonas aeruginosa]|nr:putative redox protein [Pseudomonas aeruginosa]